MKYMVVECHLSYAVVLSEDGRFLKVANLHYEIGQVVSHVVEMRQPERQPESGRRVPVRWITSMAAAAACLTLVAVAALRVGSLPYGTVYMEINPDVRIDVDRKDRVVGLEGMNCDGEALVEDYSYRRKDLELVVDELVDRAIGMDYLHEGGEITLSFDGDDSQWVESRSEALPEQLAEYLDQKLTVTITVKNNTGVTAYLPEPAAQAPPETQMPPETQTSPEAQMPPEKLSSGNAVSPVLEDTDYDDRGDDWDDGDQGDDDGLTDYGSQDDDRDDDGLTDYDDRDGDWDDGDQGDDGLTDYDDRGDDWDDGDRDDDGGDDTDYGEHAAAPAAVSPAAPAPAPAPAQTPAAQTAPAPAPSPAAQTPAAPAPTPPAAAPAPVSEWQDDDDTDYDDREDDDDDDWDDDGDDDGDDDD